MAAEEAERQAAEEAEDLLGPLPPDIVAEAEAAGDDKSTAEVLRICRCVSCQAAALHMPRSVSAVAGLLRLVQAEKSDAQARHADCRMWNRRSPGTSRAFVMAAKSQTGTAGMQGAGKHGALPDRG